MKRVDLIRAIEGPGCVLVRHGGRHDWYRNPGTGVFQPAPRHREIKDHLARTSSRCSATRRTRETGTAGYRLNKPDAANRAPVSTCMLVPFGMSTVLEIEDAIRKLPEVDLAFSAGRAG